MYFRKSAIWSLVPVRVEKLLYVTIFSNRHSFYPFWDKKLNALDSVHCILVTFECNFYLTCPYYVFTYESNRHRHIRAS